MRSLPQALVFLLVWVTVLSSRPVPCSWRSSGPQSWNEELKVLISPLPKLSVAPKHALETENLGGVSLLTASGIIFLGQ